MKIKFPNIGIKKVELIDILVQKGDLIKKKQPILIVEGDKTSLEINSLYKGIVKKIKVKIGDILYKDTIIMELKKYKKNNKLKNIKNNKLNKKKKNKINLNKIKKKTIYNLMKSWKNIPHVTQFDEINITEIEKFRNKYNKKFNVKITLLSFIIKIISKAIKKIKIFNSYIKKNKIINRKKINIGIIVNTKKGLLKPVIENVNKKKILNIHKEIKKIINKININKINVNNIKKSCFSISNLGSIGGSFFTPIINKNESSILGISKSIIKPIWNGEKFIPKLILPISLSYDHRLINGVDSTRFINFIKNLIKDIRYLIL